MSNQQIKLFQDPDILELTATAKLLSKSQNVTSNNSKPQKRYGHLSFIYKSKIYVVGGSPVDSKNQPVTNTDLKSVIYSYNLQKEKAPIVEDKKGKKILQPSDVKWQVTQAKFTPQAQAQFSLFSYSAHCIFHHKKRLYMFGGTSPQGKTSSHLFRLDLDSLQWSKPEQKGFAPKARQQAFLSLYTKNQKNYLVLYGGANYQTYELFNDIHFYQIETKYWFNCHNLSLNFIQPRILPGVCFNDNKIYVFGGYYLDVHYNKGYLNDLYQIQFNLTLEKGRPYGRSSTKRLDEVKYQGHQSEKLKPEKRCGSCLIFYKHDLNLNWQQKKHLKIDPQWLVLIGGEKSCDQKKKLTSTLNDIWIFFLSQLKWRNINIQTQFKPRSNFSGVIDKQVNKIFIFGGLSSQQSFLNDLVSVKLTSKIKQNQLQQLKNQALKYSQQKIVQQDSYKGEQIQDYFIQEICNSIQFPYSAFSLIIQNFVNFQATFCDITYHISKKKQPSMNYIRFQSNATLSMSNEALLSHFTCLKGGIRTYVQGTDKKIKAQMNKDNLLKQVGANFVIGSLRLGSMMLFMNLNPETFEIQIIIIVKSVPAQDKNLQIPKQTVPKFRIFSFIVHRQQVMSDPILKTSKSPLQQKRRAYFFTQVCPPQCETRLCTFITQGGNMIKKGQVKNLLFITKLRSVQGVECLPTSHESQLELYPDMLRNDLIYGDREVIKDIQMNSSIGIYQCMDVSLRSYLSYLYTSNCETQLTLTIHGIQRKQITMQDYLLKVDDLLKNNQISQVSNEFEIDCKIIELYHYNYEHENNQLNGSSQINGSSVNNHSQTNITNKSNTNSNNSRSNKNNMNNKSINNTLKDKAANDKFFAHGTLFYHKTRLIKRHPIQLGDFLNYYQLNKITSQQHDIFNNKNHQFIKQDKYTKDDTKMNLQDHKIKPKQSNYYSATQIFGHIQLPQAIPVNITKTDFVFPIMLQRINQKLRLMEDKVIKNKRKLKNKINGI